MKFIEKIKEKARENKKVIVLPETNDARILEGAFRIMEEGIAHIALIGDEEEIKKSTTFDLSKAIFYTPATYEKQDEFAEKLFQLRKHKGMTLDGAKELLMTNPLYFANMLVKEGVADGMVAGAANSTANVLRSALQVLSTAPGTKLVSTCFVMVVPNSPYGEEGTFVFSDCALVQQPSAEQLAEIAISASQSFASLVGKEPKVAFLSHSTKGSSAHADVDKVVNAFQIAKEKAPDIIMDGELQLDAAIIPSVGQSKAPDSPVAGTANVLIFPDIDAGNIGYKLVQRLGNADAFGPITQGIAKPVNDLSRGCTVEDIVGVAAITCVQASEQ